MVRWVLLGWILAPLLGLAADLTPPQLLSRIRNQMAQTLARLPDYTCRETIERSVQQPHSNRLENLDILHVDVAYLNGRELYAWPGARLGEHNLLEMVPDGSIGTGNFGMLARAVFADYGPIFLFQGRSIWFVLSGHPVGDRIIPPGRKRCKPVRILRRTGGG